MKAASAVESGSNLQCKFSLQCFATVIHRKSLGKGPLAPIGISKKSYRLRTVKIKELIKCRQWWEGGGSSIKLEQEVLHPHWLMLTLACLSWPAMAGPSLGGSSSEAAPQLDSALYACRDQLATYLLIIHYPCKKIVCTANLI